MRTSFATFLAFVVSLLHTPFWILNNSFLTLSVNYFYHTFFYFTFNTRKVEFKQEDHKLTRNKKAAFCLNLQLYTYKSHCSLNKLQLLYFITSFPQWLILDTFLLDFMMWYYVLLLNCRIESRSEKLHLPLGLVSLTSCFLWNWRLVWHCQQT